MKNTDKKVEALNKYLELGDNRNCKDVALACNIPEGTIYTWCRKFKWVEEAERWDAEQLELSRKECKKVFNKSEIEWAGDIKDILTNYIKDIKYSDKKPNVKDMELILKIYDKLNEKFDVKGNNNSIKIELNGEFLDELKNINTTVATAIFNNNNLLPIEAIQSDEEEDEDNIVDVENIESALDGIDNTLDT